MLRGRGYDSVSIEVILAGPEADAKTPITIVQGSARPLLAPKFVAKGEIYLVEGSARPFLRAKRTHSLWEGMMRGGGAGEGEGRLNMVGEGGSEVVAGEEDDSGI